MTPFSNNPSFERVEYNKDYGILSVIFRNGHGTKYSHNNVPFEIFKEFEESKFSKSYYFNKIQYEYERKIAFLTEEDREFLKFLKEE